MVNDNRNPVKRTYHRAEGVAAAPPPTGADPSEGVAAAPPPAAAKPRTMPQPRRKKKVSAQAKVRKAARAGARGSAWSKNKRREITGSLGRFFAIFAIIALGVGFFCGLKVTKSAMLKTGDIYLEGANFYDYRLVSTLGLVEEDAEAMAAVPGIEYAEVAVTADFLANTDEAEGLAIRAHTLTKNINKLNIVSGRAPTAANECVVDAAFFTDKIVGKTIRLAPSNDSDTFDMFKYKEYTVTGLADSPCYLNAERGTTDLAGGAVDAFAYIPAAGFNTDYYTEAYLTFTEKEPIFSDAYSDLERGMEKPVTAAFDERAEIRYDNIMDEADTELADAEKEYADGEKEYKEERAKAEKKLADAWVELQDADRQIRENEQKLIDGQKKLEDAEATFQNGYAGLTSGQQQYDAAKAQAQAELDAAQSTIDNQRAEVDAGLAQMAGIPGAEQTEQYAQLKAAEAALNAGQAELDAKKQAAAEQFAATEAQLGSAATTINNAATEIAEGQKELEDGRVKLADAKAQYADGLAEYEDGKAEAEEEFQKAENKLADARQKIDDARKEVDDIDPATTYVLGRDTNTGYVSFDNDSSIVDGIARVFPVFFFLVAALVCITTMTRMVEEQRTQIGTLKALGYSNGSIMWKYISYSGLAAVLATAVGFVGGSILFPWAIWQAYGMLYDFASLSFFFDPLLAAISLLGALLCSAGATWVACRNELAETPAELMRPRAPKAGKRIFLERMPFIWKRLGFLRKVTVRNIFRYKKRLFMMLLGIGGCTALVLAGFGIRDSISGLADFQYDTIMKYDYDIKFSKNKAEAAREQFAEQNDDILTNCVFYAGDTLDVFTTGSTKTAAVIATDDPNITTLIDLHMDGETVPWPGEGEVVVTEKLANAAGVGIGDEITAKVSDTLQASFTVSGICENYVYSYLYMTGGTYADKLQEAPLYENAFATTGSEDVHAAAAELLGESGVANVSIVADTRTQVGNMMQSLDSIVILVIGCAAALAFVVLFNLSNINITERVREIATIKVLGFYPNEVGSYVFRENFVLAAMGAVVGLPLGVLLLEFIMTQITVDFVTFRTNIHWQSYVYALVATFAFTFIVDLFMRRKLDKINMAESLKSVE